MNNELETSNGTTIIGFKYSNGLVLAADSRTSAGQSISCSYSEKIHQLTPTILFANAGNAAHTQKLRRIVHKEISKISFYENSVDNVTIVANILKNIIYSNKDFLVASIILGGFDNEHKLYKICVDGTLTESNFVISGSGGAFALPLFDSNYREDMNKEEAINFASNAVRHACHRDNSSGGVIRIATIEQNNIERYFVSGNKVFIDQ